jgi:transposase
MIMTLPAPFSLTTARRSELDSCLRKRNLPASVAMRMRIVLMLDEGASYHDIQEKLDTTAPTISLWKKRYRLEGMVGLATIHPGQAAKKLTTQLRARILAKTYSRRRTDPRTGRCEKWLR